MPDTFVYAYPWDFEGDDGAVERAAALGVGAVAVAANYHATRAARPLHPAGPIVDVPHAACYVPVRAAAWKGLRLVPKAPSWVASDNSFGLARDALQGAGLAPHAWVVLTHNSALGREHPELVVRNAFGNLYDYALCPSAPDVVEYCATLVDEIVASGPGNGLVLEACGPMGFDHNGMHEKTALAGWNRGQRDLLSLCFCRACEARYRGAGLEPDRLRDRVRSAVRSGSGSPETLLGPELAAGVTAVRTSIAAELRSLLTERIKGAAADLRVTVHGSADPWATGSFPTLAPAPGPGVDAVVTNIDDAASGAEAVANLRALVSAGGQPGQPLAAIGGIVGPSDDWADDAVVRDRIAGMKAAGLEELHLYHLGLVGEAGLRTLRRMQSAFHDGSQ